MHLGIPADTVHDLKIENFETSRTYETLGRWNV